jgi:short-subunit dehydrogenase
MDQTSKPRWRRALVTGASSGIGEAFARRLARDGSHLVIVARRADRLERLAAELRDAHGVEVDGFVADLMDRDGLAGVERLLADGARPIDLLVNNAGGQDAVAPFVMRAAADLEREAILNAIVVLRLTHAALRGMVQRQRGDVVQVSSAVAFYPLPGGATYAASKAFVNSFSEAVARELRGTGLRITVVCPGFTRTAIPARLGFNERNIPRAMWQDPDAVVDVALHAAVRGRTVVSGLLNKLGAGIAYYLPRRFVLPYIERLQMRAGLPRATAVG